MKNIKKQTSRVATPCRNESRVARNGRKPTRQATSQKPIANPALNLIIVPVDFSAGSLNSLDWAVLLAQRFEASIKLLHVLPHIYSPGRFDSPRLRSLRDQALESARRRLANLARRRVRPHVPVRHQVLKGAACHVIVEAASNTKADLIVMGSESRTGVKRLLIGSVAEETVRRAPCPVLVVRDKVRQRGAGDP